MSELKPCAHCGGLALLVPSGRKRVWVSCTACKVSTQEVHELKARKAVKAWNTRDTSAIEAAGMVCVDGRRNGFIEGLATAASAQIGMTLQEFIDQCERKAQEDSE